MSQMRREYLKGYIMSLIAEGEFSGLRSPASVVTRAIKIVAQEVPSVVKELAEMAAASGFQRASASVLGKMEEIVADIGKRGPRAVWDDLQAQYRRGIEALHGKE